MAGNALVGASPTRLSRRPQTARLRRNADVRSVLREGHAAHGRHLSVHVRPTHGATRSTVVAGRKVGTAVQRNAAKRRLRAVLQSVVLPEGHDVVIVARARMRALSHEELRATVSEQIRRATHGCSMPPEGDLAGDGSAESAPTTADAARGGR